MNEIPARVVGEDVDGEPIVRREMTADEIRERLELNVQNTTEAHRWRVLEELARQNGRGGET
jgi:hypothetical protein